MDGIQYSSVYTLIEKGKGLYWKHKHIIEEIADLYPIETCLQYIAA